LKLCQIPNYHQSQRLLLSIVDGIVRIDDYVKQAVNDGMPALALTDLSNLFGAIKFYKASRGKGLKPIIGCDIWLENTANREQPTRALLLCQNHAGYLLLCQLLSRAYLQQSISWSRRVQA